MAFSLGQLATGKSASYERNTDEAESKRGEIGQVCDGQHSTIGAIIALRSGLQA